MKNFRSLTACFIIVSVSFFYRFYYADVNGHPLRVTTWDALGYYLYLPATFIYNDITQLAWFPEIDKKYGVSGDKLYQANKYKNGNYVFKYLGGVSIIEAPLFFIGHLIAKNTNYPADGFSPPYQYSIGFGILIYVLLALFLLRKILLMYFSDVATAVTLLLLILATNILQYTAIDNALSHGPIFVLYVLVLYTTIKWHKHPHYTWAVLTGLIIGLATICRPTEAIMLFIPLLWNTNTKDCAREKWELVRKNKTHILYALIACAIGILPQLIYWKIASGEFIYNVGSKWTFLNPFFRVLFGWEKGWFIYTPVTIFFVLGMFWMKNYPFKKSVIWFCVLNIWIVISWFDWRYGGTYSTRALSQSYPVFALPLAVLIEKINASKWKWIFYAGFLFLIYVNLFQLFQYNKRIIHYDDMNRKYYSKIYLNNNPSPLEMSLLDTQEWIDDENDFTKKTIFQMDSSFSITTIPDSVQFILETALDGRTEYSWLKIESEIRANNGLWGTWLYMELNNQNIKKNVKIRLHSPTSADGQNNHYAFYFKVPPELVGGNLVFSIKSSGNFSGEIRRLTINSFSNK